MEIPVDCAEKFKPLKLLGEGGFGRVYLAEQIGLGRSVALKVLRTDTAQDEEQIRRFVEEGRITAQLSHPNVVRVIDAGARTGVPWLVYELVDGPTLAALARRQPLRWHEAVHAAVQIASALEEAHARHIVHRDVKAENVLQAADGTFKLADFGIAKWSADSSVRTRTGFVIGTPTHLAPELLRGVAPSPASDIYALGVLLYQLVTGRLPFDSENLGELMKSHLETPPETPTRLQPDLPEGLDRILKQALEKEPERRMANVGQMRRALEAIHGTEDSELYLRRTAAKAGTAAGEPRASPAAGRGRTVPVRVEPVRVEPPRARGGWAAALALVAIAAAVVLAAIPRRPVPTPSPVASPSTRPNPAIELAAEVERRRTALFRAAERVTRLHRMLLFDGGRRRVEAWMDTRPVSADFIDALREGLRCVAETVEAMDAVPERGIAWYDLAVEAEAVLGPLREDQRRYEARLPGMVARILDSARRLPPDAGKFRRDFVALMEAQVDFARGLRDSERRLADAYARSERLQEPATGPDLQPILSVKTRLTTLWLDHAGHAARGSGDREQAVLQAPVHELFAVLREIDRALVTPVGPQLAADYRDTVERLRTEMARTHFTEAERDEAAAIFGRMKAMRR